MCNTHVKICNLDLAGDEDGFRCPNQSVKGSDSKGQVVAHPKYPHETDCQKFYVCLNGVDRRPLGCPAGQVYSTETEMCDAPENVPGWFVLINMHSKNPLHNVDEFLFCFIFSEDWYKEDDEKPSKKSRK